MKFLIGIACVLFMVGCQSKNDFLAAPPMTESRNKDFHADILGQEYTLKPQDSVSVSIFKAGAAKDGIAEPSNGVNPSITSTIKGDGTISLPLVGKVVLADKTIASAEDEIFEKLKEYYKNTTVSLNMVDANIYVLGEVNKPGPVKMKSYKINLIEAIASAGDLNSDSDKSNIRIVRNLNTNPKIATVDIRDISQYKLAELMLNPNDIIYVSSSNVKIFNDAFTQTLPFLDMVNKLFNAAVSRKTLVQ